jgi:hypothetical protein
MDRTVFGEPPRAWSTATAVLVVAVGASAVAAWAVVAGHRLAGGLTAAVAALLLVAPLPGLGRLTSGPGRFARGVLQRGYEAAVLLSVAWVERTASTRLSVLALVCLGSSYVASYERARGAGLGYRQREGQAYRATVVGLLAVALLTGWVEPTLWVFLLITSAAAVVRAANVAIQERRSPRRGTFAS